jgi:hypothetical protein
MSGTPVAGLLRDTVCAPDRARMLEASSQRRVRRVDWSRRDRGKSGACSRVHTLSLDNVSVHAEPPN